MSKIEEALKKSKIDLKNKEEEASKLDEEKRGETGSVETKNEKIDDSSDDCLIIKRDDVNLKDSKLDKWDSHITTVVEKKGGKITTAEDLLDSHDNYNTVSLDRVDETLPVKETEGEKERREGVIPYTEIKNYDVDERIISYYEFIGQQTWEGPVMVHFRRFQLSLNKMQRDASCKVIVFSSAKQGEGKSFVSLNTAITLCNDKSKNVVIVDCDLRKPAISRLIGFSPENGLTEYLAKGAKIKDICFCGVIPGLTIIPAGNTATNTCELLGSGRMQQFIARLRTIFDYVIIDSPPVLAFPDAEILSLLADGVVFVVDCSKTRKGAVKQAIDSLKGCNILGCFMNKIEAHGHGTGGYGYGYGYGYRRDRSS